MNLVDNFHVPNYLGGKKHKTKTLVRWYRESFGCYWDLPKGSHRITGLASECLADGWPHESLSFWGGGSETRRQESLSLTTGKIREKMEGIKGVMETSGIFCEKKLGHRKGDSEESNWIRFHSISISTKVIPYGLRNSTDTCCVCI